VTGEESMPNVNGYELVCPVCKSKKFSERRSLLNSRGLTLLGLDWTNQGAINYICETCGYIYWFIDDGREYFEKYEENEKGIENIEFNEDMSKANEDECPICFTKHGENQKECENCGFIFINEKD
jgi:rubredoxin